MRTINLILLILLLSTHSLLGQEAEKALFKKSNSIGGFGGFSFDFNSEGNFSFIGEGAASFSNYYFGGYGYSTNLGEHYSSTSNNTYNLKSGEGGLMLGAVSNTDHFFFLFTEVKLGWGMISATRQISENIYEKFERKTQSIIPKLGLGLTPIPFVQLRLYASYHYSGAIDLDGIDSNILNTYHFGIGLYFGGL